MSNIEWTKPVCQLDENGYYIGQAEAELDTYAKDGSYLIPGGCIEADPPQAQAGQVARWNGSGWDYVADHRGKTVWHTANRTALLVTELGDIPADHTEQVPPSEHHKWDNKAKVWAISAAEQNRLAKAQLAAAKADKLAEVNSQAQAFIDAAVGLDKIPDFEVQTWVIQAAEAKAWQADNSAATPTLDAIAAARGVDCTKLKAAAYRKAVTFERLTAHVVGQRQALADRVAAAADMDALAAVDIAYTLPVEV